MEKIMPYIRKKAKRNKTIDNHKRKILLLAKKLKAIEELGGKCEKCGETKIWKLCFHHKNPLNKENEIGLLRTSKVRYSELLEEIKKCQLLCHNCHREVHYEIYKKNKISRKNKKILFKYIQNNKCEYCGYNKCIDALEFHHIDPATKYKKMASLINGQSLKNINDLNNQSIQEVKKCIIICRNCHQTIHTDINFIENNWEEIVNKSIYMNEKNIVDLVKVIELGKLGFDKYEISQKLNCSPGRVWEILKSNNLTNKKHHINKDLIIELFNKNMKISEINQQTCYSVSSIIKTIKDYKNKLMKIGAIALDDHESANNYVITRDEDGQRDEKDYDYPSKS